jgi:hypothetical protein
MNTDEAALGIGAAEYEKGAKSNDQSAGQALAYCS